MVQAGDVVDLCNQFSDICCEELKGYKVMPDPVFDFVQYHGGFATVLNVQDKQDNHYALRLFSKSDEIVSEITSRFKDITQHLKKNSSPYFVNFKEIKNGLFYNNKGETVVLMDWVGEPTLLEFVSDTIDKRGKHSSAYFRNIARELKKMFRWLHQHKIAHGDLQLENIKCGEQGSYLILVDYDSLVIPGFEGKKLITDGIKDFQHPLRRQGYCNLKIDYFSEVILYLGMLLLSIDVSLFKKGAKYLVFSKMDFDDIRSGRENDTLNRVKSLLLDMNGNPECQQFKEEINKLLELMVYNIQVDNLDDIKTIPGLESYCRICGHHLYHDYNYCCNCGCKLSYKD